MGRDGRQPQRGPRTPSAGIAPIRHFRRLQKKRVIRSWDFFLVFVGNDRGCVGPKKNAQLSHGGR